MIIIQVAGGLGNQMQQYALYRKYLSLGTEARLDLSWFQDPGAQQNVYARRALELSYFQDLPYRTCTPEEKQSLTGKDSLTGKIFRKLLPGRVQRYQENQIYDDTLLQKKDGYLCGYFACEKYYGDILGQLRELFVFPESARSSVNEKNRACMAKMADPDEIAVSIHIRRGDYLDAANASLLGGICTPEYYEGAVEALRRSLMQPACTPAATADRAKEQAQDQAQAQDQTQDQTESQRHLPQKEQEADGKASHSVKMHFYIFSDDPAYAKTLHFGLPQEENTVIDWNTGKDSLLDMQLMSCCRGNICANSTFSFWGARLNPREDKLQVRPSVHKNTQTYDPDTMHDYWKGWILVDRAGNVV